MRGKLRRDRDAPHASRNGGRVSIVANILPHREQFHQSRLVESVLPSSIQYYGTPHQVTDYFAAQGNSPLQAQQQAIQWIGQQVSGFPSIRDGSRGTTVCTFVK